jgi:hypothetical protein
MQNEEIPLVGFSPGTADIARLRSTMAQAWGELMFDAREGEEISRTLGIPSDVLKSYVNAPFHVKPATSGLFSQEVAVVLTFLLSNILGPAVIGIARDALKKKLKIVIKLYLIPRWKRLLESADSLGQQRDIDRS